MLQWIYYAPFTLTLILNHFHDSNLISTTNLSTLISFFLNTCSFLSFQIFQMQKNHTILSLSLATLPLPSSLSNWTKCSQQPLCNAEATPSHFKTPYHTSEAIWIKLWQWKHDSRNGLFTLSSPCSSNCAIELEKLLKLLHQHLIWRKLLASITFWVIPTWDYEFSQTYEVEEILRVATDNNIHTPQT